MMPDADTSLLFPPHLIPTLRDERGAAWSDLVAAAVEAGPDSLEQMAFTLMMARLDGCATCHADCYRALQGCAACARQSLRRARACDEELVTLFETARTDVENYLKRN